MLVIFSGKWLGGFSRGKGKKRKEKEENVSIWIQLDGTNKPYDIVVDTLNAHHILCLFFSWICGSKINWYRAFFKDSKKKKKL